MSRPAFIIKTLRDIAKNCPDYPTKLEACKLLLLLSGKLNQKELGYANHSTSTDIPLPKSLKGAETGLAKLLKDDKPE